MLSKMSDITCIKLFQKMSKYVKLNNKRSEDKNLDIILTNYV